MPDSISQVLSSEIAPVPGTFWHELLDNIRDGKPDAQKRLFDLLNGGIRFYFQRRLGTCDLEDRVHDVFVTVTEAIRRNEIREPERLMGYVRTIAQRHVASQIGIATRERQSASGDASSIEESLPARCPDPERGAIDSQNVQIAMNILYSLRERERQILIRFYVREQPPEKICEEMGLTATQFRLLKSRAKARFGELGRARVSRRHPGRATRQALAKVS